MLYDIKECLLGRQSWNLMFIKTSLRRSLVRLSKEKILKKLYTIHELQRCLDGRNYNANTVHSMFTTKELCSIDKNFQKFKDIYGNARTRNSDTPFTKLLKEIVKEQ